MHSLSSLGEILHRGLVWRGGRLTGTATSCVPSGFSSLDAELPGGGWPTGVLTELMPEHEGIGELRALGPALAEIAAKGHCLAWVDPPYLPYAPALHAAGIDLSKIMIIKARYQKDSLWAMEQALQSGACGAVLAWPGKVTFTQLRRLQIATERSSALAFLFRSPSSALESSPAALRLHLEGCKGDLAVKILKRRGGPLARRILLTPVPVVEPPLPAKTITDHEIEPATMDSAFSAAAAA